MVEDEKYLNSKLFYKVEKIIYEPGFINSIGDVINPSSTYNEVHSNFINMTNILFLRVNNYGDINNEDNWFTICAFDKNKSIINRFTVKNLAYQDITITEKINYIILTYRKLNTSYRMEIDYEHTIFKATEFEKVSADVNCLRNNSLLDDYFVIGDISSTSLLYLKYNAARICTYKPIYLDENDIIKINYGCRLYFYKLNIATNEGVDLSSLSAEIIESNGFTTTQTKPINMTINSNLFKVNQAGYYLFVIAGGIYDNSGLYDYVKTPVIKSVYELCNEFEIIHPYQNQNILFNGDFSLYENYFVNNALLYSHSSIQAAENTLIFKIQDNYKVEFFGNNHNSDDGEYNITNPTKSWIHYIFLDKNYNIIYNYSTYLDRNENNDEYNIYYTFNIDLEQYNLAYYCIISFRTINEPYKIYITKKFNNINEEYLEQKIQSYLNEVSDSGYKLEYETYPGFIRADGIFSAQNLTNLEYYTSLIKFNENYKYYMSIEYSEVHVMWFAIALYDENKEFIKRKSYSFNIAKYDLLITAATVENAKYFLLSYRSFGVENCFTLKLLEFGINVKNIEYVLPSKTIRHIAHRGDDIDAPQCVAPAYIAARKLGFEINENDVFNSSDGVFICWHDINLNKINVNGNIVSIEGYKVYIDSTNNIYYYDEQEEKIYEFIDNNYIESQEQDINNLTPMNGADYSVTDILYKDLKRFDFGLYYGEQFRGTQMLSFEEWVLLSKQLGMEIYIDRKNTWTDEDVIWMDSILKKYGMRDKTSWINISIDRAETLKSIYNNYRFGTLSTPTEALCEYWEEFKDNTSVRGNFFFNPDGRTLTVEQAQLAINNGYEIECWYVDLTTISYGTIMNRIRELVDMGITGLTIDKYRVTDAHADLYNKYNFNF